jgi:hypothetical protein
MKPPRKSVKTHQSGKISAALYPQIIRYLKEFLRIELFHLASFYAAELIGGNTRLRSQFPQRYFMLQP